MIQGIKNHKKNRQELLDVLCGYMETKKMCKEMEDVSLHIFKLNI